MFKVTVNHDTAAFDQDMVYPEIARILRHVADRIDQGDLDIYNYPDLPLFDINGNCIGKAEFIE